MNGDSEIKEEDNPFSNDVAPKIVYPREGLFELDSTECYRYLGTGEKKDAWDRNAVRTNLVSEYWEPDREIIRIRPWLLRKFEQERAGRGTSTDIVEYRDYFRTDRVWIERTQGGQNILCVTYKLVNYRNVVATHEYRDLALKDYYQPSIVWTLRSQYAGPEAVANRDNLPNFGFANHCGVALAICTKDNKLIFPHRSYGMEGKGGFACVGESMLAGRDQVRDGEKVVPDPFLAARNGASRELGLDIQAEAVKFLVVFFDTDYCQVVFGALVKTSKDSDEICEGVKRSTDNWEILQTPQGKKVLVVDNDPQVFSRILDEPKEKWTTWGKMAAIHALIYEHGYGKVKTAFAGAEHKGILDRIQGEWK
jgi:hypothetical protein